MLVVREDSDWFWMMNMIFIFYKRFIWRWCSVLVWQTPVTVLRSQVLEELLLWRACPGHLQDVKAQGLPTWTSPRCQDLCLHQPDQSQDIRMTVYHPRTTDQRRSPAKVHWRMLRPLTHPWTPTPVSSLPRHKQLLLILEKYPRTQTIPQQVPLPPTQAPRERKRNLGCQMQCQEHTDSDVKKSGKIFQPCQLMRC